MRRGNLERIVQQHDNSCGQSCVAMLARVTYNDVIDFMGRNYTETRDIRNGLREFGLKSARRLTQFRGNKHIHDYKELKHDAMLKLVNPRTHRSGSFHWVVWDARRRKILDPQHPRYKIPPARITSFLKVWR
jgi:hypothetical protein